MPNLIEKYLSRGLSVGGYNIKNYWIGIENMENLKKKILNVLNTNSFFVKNISFLAGDASDRKYFLAKTKKQEVIIMVDKNPDDLRQFLKITKALEKKVDENNDSVAFSIFPSSISDVITVANKNLTMPPKSTWFDPKPLDGLVVYEFEKLYE